ncbi:MAG: hypothetical protein WC346_09230 [Methanogenium sp.]|jgi:hypothetical protein
MQLYNLLSCKGFITEEITSKVSLNFGACASARLILVLIFFLNAIVRKWGGEEIGFEYNFWAGLTGGILGYLIPLMFTGNIKISFVIGLVAMLLGGYLGGSIFGDGNEDGGYE